MSLAGRPVAPRRLGELARAVGGELEGDPGVVVRGVASIEAAGPEEVALVATPRHVAAALASRAVAFVAPAGLALGARPVVRVAEPYVALAVLLELFHATARPAPGVHPTAVLAEDAQVATDATVQAFVVVGRDSVLESSVVLHPHVTVGARCRVGAGTVLHPHVVLGDDVEIGRRVVIHAGSVLGADGFGYVFDGSRHRKIPQVGRVVVEDEVEIGANVAIDRATMGETRIGRGTKIDNLVQIGHNVTIGFDCVIVAQTGIAGSCRLGRGVVLGGQVGVADHAVIGDGAQVGSQSGVHGVVEAGARMLGSPALPVAQARRAMAGVGHLPDVLRTVRALRRRLDALERRLGVVGEDA